MKTVYRAAELHQSDGVPAGVLDLGYLTGLLGFDEEISLLRAYTDSRSCLEDDFSTYPGGPGFGILHRAITCDGVTMLQAAAWWETYRLHPQVLLYRTVFAVDTNPGLTTTYLSQLLHASGVIPEVARHAAIETAICQRLISVSRGGRLDLTPEGTRLLHRDEPDRIGEDDPAIFAAVPR